MQELINTLLATCEQLVKEEMKWADANRPVIEEVFKKIEDGDMSVLNRIEKVALSEYFDIRMYNGKILAYIFVMQQLNGGTIDIPAQYPLLQTWVHTKMKTYAN